MIPARSTSPWRRFGLGALGVLVVGLLLLPGVVKNAFAIDVLIRILLFAFIGNAWNLMGGYAKQLSAWGPTPPR
jgi:branched-chain amino acid transport system permease protein